jgi:hypothetical protein
MGTRTDPACAHPASTPRPSWQLWVMWGLLAAYIVALVATSGRFAPLVDVWLGALT